MTLESDPVPMALSSLKRQAHDTTSPSIRTPSRIATPPPPSDRGTLHVMNNGDGAKLKSARHSGRGSSIGGIDPENLTRALSRELSGERRESTPGASPSRKRQRINADR